MFIAVKTLGPGEGDWRYRVPPMPFIGRLTVGSAPSDIELPLSGPACIALEARGGKPPLIRAVTGPVKVNGKRLVRPRTLSDGMRIRLAGTSISVVAACSGFLLIEAPAGQAAETAGEYAGMELLRLPEQFVPFSGPQQALEAVQQSLHLAGVGLLERQSDGSVSAERWAGERWPAGIERHAEVLGRGFMLLEYTAGRSLAVLPCSWPYSGQCVLVGWSGRPVSLSYLANLYRLLPRIVASLLIERRIQDVSAAATADWLAALGFVASGVGHVFNNSLAPVYGYVRLAERDSGFLGKLGQSVLSATQRAEGLLAIFSSLLPAAEAAERFVKPQEVVSKLLPLVLPNAQRCDVTADFTCEDVVGVTLPAAASYRLLFLLAFHAITRTPAGQTAALKIRGIPGGLSIILAAGDKPGETTTPPAYLPYLNNLVRTLGGELKAPHGMCIEITLPAAKGAAGPILLVEDDAEQRRLAALALRPLEVHFAASAAEALERLRQQTYNTIILDLLLANGSAAEPVYEYMRCNAPATRVIITTGLLLDDSAKRKFAGCLLLKKPYSLDELRRAVLGE